MISISSFAINRLFNIDIEEEEEKKGKKRGNKKYHCTHKCHTDCEDIYPTEQLSAEVLKEATDIVERHFSRKIVTIKELQTIDDNGISAIERVMRFLNKIKVPLSNSAISELKSALGDNLKNESFEYTNKVLDTPGVDVKLTEDKGRKNRDNKGKEKDREKGKDKGKDKDVDECDAFGLLDLIKDFKNAVSNKDNDTVIDCLLTFLEIFAFASYTQQKYGVKIIESCYKQISKHLCWLKLSI